MRTLIIGNSANILWNACCACFLALTIVVLMCSGTHTHKLATRKPLKISPYILPASSLLLQAGAKIAQRSTANYQICVHLISPGTYASIFTRRRKCHMRCTVGRLLVVRGVIALGASHSVQVADANVRALAAPSRGTVFVRRAQLAGLSVDDEKIRNFLVAYCSSEHHRWCVISCDSSKFCSCVLIVSNVCAISE